MAETKFEMAQRHVTEGRRIVAEQRDRVAALKAHGRDAHEAQRELELCEDSLAIFEEHLKSLQPEPASPILHIEFFVRATEFRRAYEALPISGRPPEWPKYFLFCHAVELALKAYLVHRGVSQADLKKKFGHNIKKLVNKAVAQKLSLPDGTQGMIAALSKAHLQQLPRYPPNARVYSLGQFEPHLHHVFSAVEGAIGLDIQRFDSDAQRNAPKTDVSTGA